MANTYSQMYVQIVFAFLGRANVITEIYRTELEKYICGIITDDVSKYVLNQKDHHKKRTFKEEYLSILRKNGIDYGEIAYPLYTS
jgi:hypothetical protein